MDEFELHSRALAYSAAPIALLDSAGRIVFFNRACERASGRPLEEVRGHPFWDILPPGEAREQMRSLLETALTQPWANAPCGRWIANAGGAIEWRLDAIPEKNQPLAYWVCTGRDIPLGGPAVELDRALPLALWFLEPASGKIFDLGAGLEAMLGLDGLDPEAAWERFLESIHPEERETVLPRLQRAITRGEPIMTECRIVRPSGEVRWIQCRMLAGHESVHALLRIVGYAQDITERKTIEQILRATLHRQEALLDSIPDIAWLKDAHGRYLAVNRVFGEIFGVDPEAVAGKTDGELFEAPLAQQGAQEHRAVVASGQPQRTERCVTHHGKRLWLETVTVPIHDDRGAVTGTAGTARDITERKLAEARRLAREAALREALAKEIHHRIKNHLQKTISLLQQLAEGHPESAQALETAIARLDGIASVHGLLGATGEREPRLDQLLLKIVSSLKELHPERPLRLSVHNPTAARIVEREVMPLALIVNELIVNAFKHSDACNRAAAVEVVLGDGKGGALIAICNATGRLPSDFDFDSGTGLGTGLTLVKWLLPPEGARMRFRAAGEGGGTRVELALQPPVLVPAPAAMPSASDRIADAGSDPDR